MRKSNNKEGGDSYGVSGIQLLCLSLITLMSQQKTHRLFPVFETDALLMYHSIVKATNSMIRRHIMITRRFLNTVLLLMLFNFIPLQMFSQTSEVDDEILVYFLPDSLDLPQGMTELIDVSKLTIRSKDLSNVFKNFELKSIKKAFPEFNINDTLKLREDNSKIKLPNMSRIFKLKLKKKDDLQTVIDLLSKEKSVLFAESNGIAAPAVVPNDQYFSYQWSLQPGGGT